MTDSNTTVIKKYIRPSPETLNLSKEEIQNLLGVQSISSLLYSLFQGGGKIICNSTSSMKRGGWVNDDSSGLQWLIGRGYTEAFYSEEVMI